YRCRRRPWKPKPVAIEKPAVVTIDPKTRIAWRGSRHLMTREAIIRQRLPANTPAWRGRAISSQAQRPYVGVILPSHRPEKRPRSDVPDMTPEEHRSEAMGPTRCGANWCGGPPDSDAAALQRSGGQNARSEAIDTALSLITHARREL